MSAQGLRIIVFGGGNIALRKCRFFEGADITVIASDILPEIRLIARNVIERTIQDDIVPVLNRYDAVIAATDSKELNDRIRDTALSAGLLTNSAHGGGNLLIPSVLNRDKYVVAVSSEGRVPAFPPYLVNELNAVLDERYDNVIDLLIELRAISKDKIASQPERRRFLESVLSNADIMDAAKEGRISDARSIALELGGML